MKVRILILVCCLAFYSCGGGASAPTTPAQIPTTIEGFDVKYDAGDVVVKGSIAGITASISLLKATSASVAVFAVNPASGVTVGEFDSNTSRFYITPQAGNSYAFLFVTDSAIFYYFNSDLRTSSLPIDEGLGAGSAGTAVYNSNGSLASGSVKEIDLGEVTLENGLTGGGTSGSITTGGASGSTVIESAGYTQDEIEESDYSDYDGPLSRFASSDFITNNGIDLMVDYFLEPTGTLSDLADGEYPDPSTLSYAGYGYSTHSATGSGEAAFLTAPVDIIDKNGETFSAGTAIQSCYYSSGSYEFLTTDINCGVAVNPTSPSAGNYTVTMDGTEYTFSVDRTQNLTDMASLDKVPLILPKLIIENGYWTGIKWKIVKKKNGTFTPLTLRDAGLIFGRHENQTEKGFMLSASDSVNNILDEFIRLNEGCETAGISGCEDAFANSGTAYAAGQLTFSTPLDADAPHSIGIMYYDVAGYDYRYTWGGSLTWVDHPLECTDCGP